MEAGGLAVVPPLDALRLAVLVTREENVACRALGHAVVGAVGEAINYPTLLWRLAAVVIISRLSRASCLGRRLVGRCDSVC